MQCANTHWDRQYTGRESLIHTDICRGQRVLIWVVSRDGSSVSVQRVLRVFKWVKSQLWLPDGGWFDPDHSDRPGLWCASAYYWHYRQTGIFLPNYFQLVRPARAGHTKIMCMCPCMNASVYASLCTCVHVRECIYYFTIRLCDPVTHMMCVFNCADIFLCRQISIKICNIHSTVCGDPACLCLFSGCILNVFLTFHCKSVVSNEKQKGNKRGKHNGLI